MKRRPNKELWWGLLMGLCCIWIADWSIRVESFTFLTKLLVTVPYSLFGFVSIYYVGWNFYLNKMEKNGMEKIILVMILILVSGCTSLSSVDACDVKCMDDGYDYGTYNKHSEGISCSCSNFKVESSVAIPGNATVDYGSGRRHILQAWFLMVVFLLIIKAFSGRFR